MGKIQVFYYTRTGRSEIVAKSLAEKYNITSHQITEDENYNGVLGFIKGGAKASKKEVTQIKHYDIDKTKTIVLVCPIWAGKFPPAVNTFIQASNRENIILIPTSLKTKLKDRENYKQVVDLIGKDIYNIPIDLDV